MAAPIIAQCVTYVSERAQGYPFEVLIPSSLPVSGAVLSDQVKSLDWRARGAEPICSLPQDAVAEILGKLGTLLG